MVKELRSGSFNVAGTASFVNGDGLCFFDADRQLKGFRVNRAEGNRLFPLQMPAGLKVRTLLLAVPLGILGARAFYVLARLNFFAEIGGTVWLWPAD